MTICNFCLPSLLNHGEVILHPLLLAKANTLLCRDTDMTGRFVTLFYLRLEAGGIAPEEKLLWARAGHDPGMLFDPKTDTFRELQGKGIALGVSPDYLYETFSGGRLLPGQVLVLATDGAWEARNGHGEMFGKERFRDVVRRYATKDIQGSRGGLAAGHSGISGGCAGRG